MTDKLEDHIPEARVHWRDVPPDALVSKFILGAQSAFVAVLPDGPATVFCHDGEGEEAWAAMDRQRVEGRA